MQQRRFTVVLMAAVFASVLHGPATAGLDETLVAGLTGFQEVPPVSTAASGTFQAIIHGDEDALDYELTYEGLEAPVTVSHIHFGQPFVSGGIVVFLCETPAAPDPTGAAPTCPQSGRVTGTVTAATIIGPAGQGIAPEEFAEFLRALRHGVTYANVHSQKFPSGEIRGQIIKSPE
jgi:hypothetical protein